MDSLSSLPLKTGSRHLDLQELESYLSGYWISDLSNFSAYLAASLPDLNWVGFYLSDGTELRLGPFQGLPACLRIPFGRGVCGQAFSQGTTLRVDDVDQFPGHIRCDARSKSELVIPFRVSETIVGVLDLDSPYTARFSSIDQNEIESALQLLSQKLEQSHEVKHGLLL